MLSEAKGAARNQEHDSIMPKPLEVGSCNFDIMSPFQRTRIKPGAVLQTLLSLVQVFIRLVMVFLNGAAQPKEKELG